MAVHREIFTMENNDRVPLSGHSSQGRNFARRMKLQGISIVASVALPIVAAYIVFYTGTGLPEGTLNQGELLQPPVNLSRMPFIQGEEEVSLIEKDAPKWRYLILSNMTCDKECEQLLYTSRQVHIRLGEKANRVERLLVTGEPLTADETEKLRQEHPRLKVLQLNRESLRTLQEQTAHQNIANTRAVLIDQQGFAMMAYDNHHSGNQWLKDIKRLLKYSYEQ
ncbi:hypothetical protein [Microbulbifer sp. 2205BS26-8]|uniref:hypothetical protein n=1 Tax=Microbulbifer sp. 2205BS26-8 TaxID=3064386 RepID=UPI00273F79E5|nr:hypothetical protein [Microbulbifer sp. 2205BS26-8]MDP5210994.1 hypothetical protein [Microbulbifer sp. 2205BS26-8]